jgi:hypothetical protein
MSAGGGHRGFQFPFLHELDSWVEKTAVEKGGFFLPATWLFGAAIGGAIAFNFIAPLQSLHNWDLVFLLAPLWMPVMVGRFAMLRFIQMRRSYTNFQNKFVLLELRMPREVLKTPQAMETVLASLNVGPGEGTWWKKWWWGKTRPWWSLEMTSIDGTIRMYIYTRVGMRRGTESFFYAQYPEIEIIEVKDYSRMRDPSKPEYTMDAFEFKEGERAPFPIKTYVDYGLDKAGTKVEFQVDPLAQVFELLGSIGPGEQIWLQMIIRVAKVERFRGALNAKGKRYSIKDEAKEEVEAIRSNTLTPTGIPNPTEVQRERIAAIERNMGKLLFDVGMRVIYSAPAGQGKGMGGPLLNMWKPMNSPNYNSIDPAPAWGAKYNDYPWEDMGGKRKRRDNFEAVEFYRYRSFFHPPYRGHWMTMSTEELATIFHFPTSSVKTPSLDRITSNRSAPPANLPQ